MKVINNEIFKKAVYFLLPFFIVYYTNLLMLVLFLKIY